MQIQKIINFLKKLLFRIGMLISIVVCVWIFEDEITEFKYFLWANFSNEYQQHKLLIEPYFDEEFYISKYGEAVKKSGLKAIDHFLQKGWQSNNWRNHTDPNPWFNTTLYKERLWILKKRGNLSFLKIVSNPLADFLVQPKLSKHDKTIEIYASADELGRVWLAIEGFLRLNRFSLNLHLPKNLNTTLLIRFKPQVERGLKIIFDNYENKSFYQNNFIKNPDLYKICELEPKQYAVDAKAITYVKNDFHYLMHRLYNYTRWYEIGTINPIMVNIAHYCDEPIIFARFGSKTVQFRQFLKNLLHGKWEYPEITQQDFNDYVIRISDGFDLCLLNSKLPIKKLRVIPGFLHAYINPDDLDKIKKFGISYLLSLGGAGIDAYRQKNGLIYNLRKAIWDREKDLKIPTQFYLSFRDKDKYPKVLQNRVLPTDSKKWIFNSQFVIAIENTQQDDYFTEKLLGCFLSLSVPIYIGCPNVSEYFDTRGMIIVNSLQELINAVNLISEETYAKMLPYLKENRNRSLKLLNLEKEVIAEFFNKNHLVSVIKNNSVDKTT